MHNLEIQTTQNVGINYPTASLVERLFAFLIDQAIIIASIILIILLLGTIESGIENNTDIDVDIESIYLLTTIPIFFLYRFAFEFFNNGQTPGKKFRNIKVMKLDGSRPTLGTYFTRWIFGLLEFFLLMGSPAVLAIMLTNKSQRVGDIVANSAVIKNEPLELKKHLVDENYPQDYEMQFPKASLLKPQQAELINQVLNNPYTGNRNKQITLLADKIKETFQINDELERPPRDFLEQYLRDYAYIFWLEENRGQLGQLKQDINKLFESNG